MGKQNKIIPMMQGALDIAKESGEEYLRVANIPRTTDNRNIVCLWSLGGEVFADKPVDLLMSIGDTKYAKIFN